MTSIAPAGCTVRVWYDIANMCRWMQHGDNPEARRSWTDRDLVSKPKAEMLEEIRAWLEACHARQPCDGSALTRERGEPCP